MPDAESLRAAVHEHEPRVVVATSAAAAVAYGLVWRGGQRLADTPGYEADGHVLRTGWDVITERTPGYPALLWATGSLDGPSNVLLAVQLALLAAMAVLLWWTARRLGATPRVRLVVALAVLSPPIAQMARYSGPEMLTALLVAAVVAAAARDRGRWGWVACGALCGVVALVRPAVLLLGPAVAASVLVHRATVDRRWRRALLGAVLVTAPWLVLVGGYVGLNATRFDRATVTPMVPWNLSTTTSRYVERLPPSFEPLRSALVERRDRVLLAPGTDHDPTYFVSCLHSTPACPRREMAAELGVSDRELDEWMLEADIWLITHEPQSFATHAATASATYSLPWLGPALDPGDDGSRVGALAWGVVLYTAMPVVATGLVGQALRWGVERSSPAGGPAIPVAFAAVVVAWFQSAVLESGAARHRLPTDPLIVLLAALGLSFLARCRARARPPQPRTRW